MRIGWSLVLSLCAIALAACAPVGAGYEESLMGGFDPREWTVGHQAATPRQRIIEFVPPGQKITAWTELLTVQTLAKPQPAPDIDALAASAYEPLSKRCPAGVTRNVIQRQIASSTEAASLLYEWGLKDCPPDADLHEVARIIYGRFTIFRLAYAAKTSALEPAKRDRWIRDLSAARIIVSKRP